MLQRRRIPLELRLRLAGQPWNEPDAAARGSPWFFVAGRRADRWSAARR